MILLPDDLVARIPPLHTQDSLPDNQLIAYARLTLKDAGLTWFVLELHRDQDTFSAYLIDSRQEQFGYFSFSYLEEHLGIAALDVLAEIPGEGFILGLSEVPSALAYNESFSPKPLIDAVREERILRHAKGEGLPTDSSLARHRAYYYAVAFTHDARTLYQVVREIIHRNEVNLSAFHLPPPILPDFWYIVVIGDRPSETVHKQIMNTLTGGSVTTIPYELLMELFARKIEENKKGTWREHHRTIRVKRKQKGKKNKRDPRHRRRS